MHEMEFQARLMVKDTRENLIRQLRNLGEACQREVTLLEGDENRTPNPLGIVQIAGLEIDRLCCMLAMQREAIKSVQILTKNGDRSQSFLPNKLLGMDCS